MDNIIEINHLKRYFGDVKAVDDISFTVERGILFAFLGINGAGKSTTINILSTLLAKDDGDVTIDGLSLDKDDAEIRKRIGIVFQHSILDDKLSVLENLTIRASFYGLKGAAWKQRLNELTELLQLEELLPRPFGKLSGGQRRRIDIARGLINAPKLLFLDEPTTGLDPNSRMMIWDIIHDLQAKTGMTVFLTTHYMEEADKAHRVVIIDSGKIIANDTPTNLKNTYSGDYIKLYTPQTEEFDKQLSERKLQYHYEDIAYVIRLKNSEEAKSFIVGNQDILGDFEVVKGNMDDVFLRATGKKLEVV